jgi:hypothetical protein
MVKKRTTITLDPETISVIKLMKLSISEIAQEACDNVILAYYGDGKSESKSYIRLVQKDMLKKIRLEKAQEVRDMRAHIKAAKAAGKTRGEAETDWNKGTMFPDRLWNEA